MAQQQQIEQLQGESDEHFAKSQQLGNIRTGALGGTTATSIVSAISTGINLKTLDEIREKMRQCDQVVGELRNIRTAMLGAGAAANDSRIQRITDISDNCTGFDEANIESIKNQMKASTIVSGIGGGVAAAGTIMSAVAVHKEANGANATTDTKGLNIGANIAGGVSAATSGTSVVLNAVSAVGLKKNAETAIKCQNVF